MPLPSGRASGILLHPTSLPGPHGSGDLGASAHHFVDWLVAAGQLIDSFYGLCLEHNRPQRRSAPERQTLPAWACPA